MDKYQSIKRACEINDAIFREIIKKFNFRTEKELANFILKKLKEFKLSKSFDPIVANNNSVIHPKPRNKKFERGFCIIDFGSRYKGFCSDITRTVFLGKANKRERDLYNLVLSCQKGCIRKVDTGVRCKDLYYYAVKLLGKRSKFFTHSLGHGVGKKIHIRPKLGPKSSEVLRKGDIITIEPGIYIKRKGKELGIRIEDTLQVGNKVEILTKSPKRLIEIKI